MKIHAFLIDITLLSIVAVTGILLWSSSKYTQPMKQPDSYDAFAKTVTTVQYNKHGYRKYQLQSPRLYHFNDDNRTKIESPVFNMYNQDGEPWVITSDYALALNGLDEIKLIGEVKASGDKTTKFSKALLKSNEVSYFPEAGEAVTYEPVTIFQSGMNLHAKGMKIYFKENKIKLLSEIRGKYDPAKK